MLGALDGFLGVDHAERRLGGCLVPDVAAILPDEGVDLHGREIIALASLVGDAEEIIVGHAIAKLVTLLALEKLADILVPRPVDIRPVFIGAGQLLVELLLVVRRFGGVAEQVLAEEGDVVVRELREAVVVFRLVGVGRIGVADGRMHVGHDGLQFRVRVDIFVELEIMSALDKIAQPLAVGDDHLVFFLARGQRRGDALIEARPRNEIDDELDGVARLGLVGFVKLFLHEAGRQPVGCRHVDDDVLGAGRRACRRCHKGPGHCRQKRCTEFFECHFLSSLSLHFCTFLSSCPRVFCAGFTVLSSWRARRDRARWQRPCPA